MCWYFASLWHRRHWIYSKRVCFMTQFSRWISVIIFLFHLFFLLFFQHFWAEISYFRFLFILAKKLMAYDTICYLIFVLVMASLWFCCWFTFFSFECCSSFHADFCFPRVKYCHRFSMLSPVDPDFNLLCSSLRFMGNHEDIQSSFVPKEILIKM